MKRNLIPLTAPFRVRPRMRKMVRTRYGRVEVMYTAWCDVRMGMTDMRPFGTASEE